jgi:hypothetical protein
MAHPSQGQDADASGAAIDDDQCACQQLRRMLIDRSHNPTLGFGRKHVIGAEQ